MIGQKFKSPSGVEVTTPPNHHMAKPVMIGEVLADGQFSIVYQSAALPPKPLEPVCRGEQGSGRGLVLALGLRRLHGTQIHDILKEGKFSQRQMSTPLTLVGGVARLPSWRPLRKNARYRPSVIHTSASRVIHQVWPIVAGPLTGPRRSPSIDPNGLSTPTVTLREGPRLSGGGRAAVGHPVPG